MLVTARLRELWQFREVIKNFVAQDLKVKYRRSTLGFFWSLLNPLLQMAVISVVFSLIFRWNLHRFVLYLFSGLLPWTFFATSVDGCSMSIVSVDVMLRRQYFPKLVFPLSLVLQNAITFVLSLAVLLVILGPFTGFSPTWPLAVLPLSVLCLAAFTLGLGALAAVVTVYFRDMKHLIGVALSAWMYLTPIIYPLETADAAGPIPPQYHFYFKLNPLYSLVQMFHRPIFDAIWPTPAEMFTAFGVAGVTLFVGLAVFWRREDTIIFSL